MLMRAATVVQVLQDFEAPPTIAPRPPTTVANPHFIDRSLGSKETHIQSHNHDHEGPRKDASDDGVGGGGGSGVYSKRCTAPAYPSPSPRPASQTQTQQQQQLASFVANHVRHIVDGSTSWPALLADDDSRDAPGVLPRLECDAVGSGGGLD